MRNARDHVREDEGGALGLFLVGRSIHKCVPQHAPSLSTHSVGR